MTLKVINGGGSGGSGGGASAAGSSGGTGPSFRPHPLAEALLDVLTRTKGLRTVGQIATEMSRLLRRRITHGHVNSVIRHNRDNIAEYEWMVTYVQKGAGKQRMYWVQDGTKAVIAKHKEAYDAGMLSAVRNFSTEIEHAESMSQMFSEIENLSRGERRKYNKQAGDISAINTLVQNLLTAISA